MSIKETGGEKANWRKNWLVSLSPEIDFKAEAWRLDERICHYLKEKYQAQNLALRIDKRGLEKIVYDLDLLYSELMVLAIVLIGQRKAKSIDEQTNSLAETDSLILNNDKEVDEVFFVLKEIWENKEKSKKR